MSSSIPLRRSQRGKRPLYQPGDIVEIVRDDGISTGQLLSALPPTKHTTSKRWLVSFDDAKLADEELCENSLGRLVQSAAIEQRHHHHTESSEKGKGKRGRKKHAKDNANDNTNDGCITTGTKGDDDSGEQEEGEEEGDNPTGVKTRGLARRKPSNAVVNKTVRKKAGRKPKQATKKEQVVKVKYRTGTLYLYRGENARAVFVRNF
eukprot:CAMPEP_0172495862 /NCGR_PEP_ID=MMETSP1066-20121228/79208_1 /TAXON_ID=671091 /ORGANISM="Coscinodiscus wailesii, Strain CCMP2513" /LENGTH=205 /DNA_ID=CAMNT_0013267845 /DNA_START=62 /DNA_END=679 /DNA_ORIENTATION=+